MLIPIPVGEAFEGADVPCAGCGVSLVEAYAAAGGYHCEACVTALVGGAAAEAREYARAECPLTRSLPRYDPALEYRCTREEYAGGDRQSYTPNAYACYCRHACTNYDELIRDLDRGCAVDNVYYDAIRARVEELLDEAEEAQWLDDDGEGEDGVETGATNEG